MPTNQIPTVIIKGGTANKLTLWELTAPNTYTEVPSGDSGKVAKAATTANITLSGAQTVDGVSLVAGDFCLVKNQTTAANNGYYKVAVGAWVLQSPAQPTIVFVTAGTSFTQSMWILTATNTYKISRGALA